MWLGLFTAVRSRLFRAQIVLSLFILNLVVVLLFTGVAT